VETSLAVITDRIRIFAVHNEFIRGRGSCFYGSGRHSKAGLHANLPFRGADASKTGKEAGMKKGFPSTEGDPASCSTKIEVINFYHIKKSVCRHHFGRRFFEKIIVYTPAALQRTPCSCHQCRDSVSVCSNAMADQA
jgi:hypothetical protein